MITVDEKEIIRREYFLHRKSMRQIAREMHHGRKTIRKAIYDPGIPVYNRSKPAPKAAIGPFQEVIQQWLQEDKQRPVKQRHTAKRIYQRLREEYGYQGSDRTVRREVSALGARFLTATCLRPISPGGWRHLRFWRGLRDLGRPGDQGAPGLSAPGLLQPVFCLCPAHRSGRKPCLNVTCGALPIWGVPGRMRYDNLKPAVHKILTGQEPPGTGRLGGLPVPFSVRERVRHPGPGPGKGRGGKPGGLCAPQFSGAAAGVRGL